MMNKRPGDIIGLLLCGLVAAGCGGGGSGSDAGTDLSAGPDLAMADQLVANDMAEAADMTRAADLAMADLTTMQDLATPLDFTVLPDLAELPDLAIAPDLVETDLVVPSDLVMPPDLATPPDLVPLPDLATRPDLTTPPDLAAPPDLVMGPRTWDVTVGSSGLSFSPPTVMIKVGDTVRWTWASSFHNVVSGNSTTCVVDNKFCSPSDSNCSSAATSNAGATYTHTFTQAGTFPYFCAPHCGAGMVGSVIVQ